MKTNILSLLFLSLIFAAGCGDDDGNFTNPIVQLGRFDGWQIVSVESDLSEQTDNALAMVSDEDIQQTGQTRQQLQASLDSLVMSITGVEDCERDDVLFFSEGVVAYGENGTACSMDGLSHVLAPLNNKRFSLNSAATTLTISSSNGTPESAYEILELSDNGLRLRQTRQVNNNLLLPAYAYTITYDFLPR